MSPSVFIVTRETKTGRRWHVRYRLGGRYAPLRHGGAFKSHRDARAREQLIAGEIAAGRDPRDLLDTLAAPRTPPATFADDAARWLHDRAAVVAPATVKANRDRVAALLPLIGDQPTSTLTTRDLQTLVVTPLAETRKPATVKRTVLVLRQILDAAGRNPNPARALKLPAIVHEEHAPPTSREVLAILERLPRRWRLPFLVLEQTGARVGETFALTWADVDVDGARFRMRGETTKSRRPRWVQVPGWLLELVLAQTPPDDRELARPVFRGDPAGLRGAMLNACRAAGLAVYSPHDLRHRRLSLWHGQGVPARELATRAGHARPSITLDVYSHVMPLDELDVEQARYLIGGRS